MSIMTSHSVVDRLAAALAERRRNTIYRNNAYFTLARAIVSDEPLEQSTLAKLERLGQAQTAA